MMHMRTCRGCKAWPRVGMRPMNFVGQAHRCENDHQQGHDQETKFNLIPLVLAVAMVDHNIAFHVFFRNHRWIECSNTALARRCSKRRLDIFVPCSVDRAAPLPPHSYWKKAWISTPSWMLSVYLASCFQHVSNTPWCTVPGLHGGQTMPPGLLWRIPSLARSISFLIQMLSRSRYDELVVSCCHVHLCSKELRRWIQSNREGHVYHLQQHFSYQSFNLPRALATNHPSQLTTRKNIGIPNTWGSWDELCIKNASSFPNALEFERKTVQMLVDLCFSPTATLHTLAQKPPMFQSLSDRIVSRNASGKKTHEDSDVCDSAGSEDSAEQQKFALKPTPDNMPFPQSFLKKIATKPQNSRWPSNTWGSSLRLLSWVIRIHEPGPTWVLHLQTASMKCQIANPSQSWFRPFKHSKQALQALQAQTGLIEALRHDFPTTRHISALNPRVGTRVRWSCSVGCYYDTIELHHVPLSNSLTPNSL